MSLRILPVVLFTIFTLLVCCATAADLYEEFTWKTPSERPFPILAWGGPPKTLLADTIWADLANAGFNLCETRTFTDTVSIRKVLKLGDKFGIGMIIRDPRIRYNDGRRKKESEIEDAVHQWKDEPALAGYSVKDEPHSRDFNELRRIKSTLSRLDEGRLFYVNLFPNYAKDEQLGSESYPEHVDKFMSTYQPRILSYDHYGIYKNSVRDKYYLNLETIREAARKSNVPFWAFTLSTPHWDYPVPTEGHIRFQLFSNLAYGAKGVQYFTYGPAMENDGIIDEYGRKTRTYKYAYNVNWEIQSMGPVLLQLESTEVFHTASNPKGTKKFKGYGGVIKCSGDPAVLGFFTDPDGQVYLMVVNSNPFKAAEITLEFAAGIDSVEEVDKYRKDGQLIDVELNNNELKLYLLEGDGRLFMIPS